MVERFCESSWIIVGRVARTGHGVSVVFIACMQRSSEDEDIQQKSRGSVAADARTVPGHAARRHGATVSERILGQQRARTLCRCRVGRATVRFCEQVRQRLWLAELYEADRT